MSSDVILYCEQLKLAVGGCDTKKASMNLDAIDQYFNDRVSEDEIGKFQPFSLVSELILMIFFSHCDQQIWPSIKYSAMMVVFWAFANSVQINAKHFAVKS